MGLDENFLNEIENEEDEVVDEVEKVEETNTEKESEKVETEEKENPVEEIAEEEVKETEPEKKIEDKEEYYKLKINGEEKEYTKDQVVMMAQKAAGADAKFEETAKAREQLEGVLYQLKNNPIDVLHKLGVNVAKMAESYLLENIKYEQMNEEQRSIYDERKKLAEERAEAEELRRNLYEMQEKNNVKKLEATYRENLKMALEKSVLPKTTDVANRIIRKVIDAYNQGIDMTFERATKLTEDDVRMELKSIYGKMEGEKLYNELGGDITKKIRDQDIKKIKKPENTIDKKVESTGKKKKTKQSWAEFKEELAELAS